MDNKIKNFHLITRMNWDTFVDELQDSIDTFQDQGYTVEIQYSFDVNNSYADMSPSTIINKEQKYYSALVIARGK